MKNNLSENHSALESHWNKKKCEIFWNVRTVRLWTVSKEEFAIIPILFHDVPWWCMVLHLQKTWIIVNLVCISDYFNSSQNHTTKNLLHLKPRWLTIHLDLVDYCVIKLESLFHVFNCYSLFNVGFLGQQMKTWPECIANICVRFICVIFHNSLERASFSQSWTAPTGTWFD